MNRKNNDVINFNTDEVKIWSDYEYKRQPFEDTKKTIVFDIFRRWAVKT